MDLLASFVVWAFESRGLVVWWRSLRNSALEDVAFPELKDRVDYTQ